MLVTVNYGLSFNAKFICPFRGSLNSTLIFDAPCIASIIGILFWRSPSAIIGRISSVVVDPINLLTLWAGAHISQKILEIIPSFTDGDSAIGVTGLLTTPSTHLNPDLIGRIVDAA